MSKPALFWVIAIEPEVKAIREIRKLNKKAMSSVFDLYHNETEDEWLIRCGVGRIDAAMSIGFLGARFHDVPQKVFGNVGIAGAGGVALGSIWAANKVVDGSTGQTYYPGLIPIRGLPSMPCHTVDAVERKYPDTTLYEMEAAGFMRATRKLTPTDGVGVLKIVSDTPSHSVERITKNSITDSVMSASDEVNLLAHNLVEVSRALHRRNAPSKHLEAALLTHRFSASQQVRLTKLLRRWDVLCPMVSPLSILHSHRRDVVLDELESALDDVPLELE